ncbi:MAG TPA: L,D-transpeptidase family protein [Acidimicrobiales bacterium]|nr:L,D-transpeptidase family protein [Acidimicrobiales bacterium]
MPTLTARLRIGAILVIAGTVASACTNGSGNVESASMPSTTTTTTPTTTTSTTTTTIPPTTTTPPPPGLGNGATGAEVQALEQRLAELKYDPGKVDGVYDSSTGHAVMAFQKTHGMHRTGRATPDVLHHVTVVGEAPPMMPDGGPNRVEVDLKRQVLFLYKDGALLRVLSVSTGNNKRYCVDGECATAVTPGGSFRITRRILGLRVSRLGKLYNPLYFNGGIAFHGSPSVPAYPASHGCVRLPMHVSRWFYDTVPNGTPVYVLGGKRAPVPFNEQAPPEEPAPTTTAVPTTLPEPTTTAVPTTLPEPTATSTTSTTSTTTTAPPLLP